MIKLRVEKFWSDRILVISNQTRVAHSFDFEITRIISESIIYIKKFQLAHWLRTRQLIPNSAGRCNWMQKVKIKIFLDFFCDFATGESRNHNKVMVKKFKIPNKIGFWTLIEEYFNTIAPLHVLKILSLLPRDFIKSFLMQSGLFWEKYL